MPVPACISPLYEYKACLMEWAEKPPYRQDILHRALTPVTRLMLTSSPTVLRTTSEKGESTGPGVCRTFWKSWTAVTLLALFDGLEESGVRQPLRVGGSVRGRRFWRRSAIAACRGFQIETRGSYAVDAHGGKASADSLRCLLPGQVLACAGKVHCRRTIHSLVP